MNRLYAASFLTGIFSPVRFKSKKLIKPVRMKNLTGVSIGMLLFVVINFTAISQDTIYVRRMLDSLTSPSMNGRGYVNEGNKTAAFFLEKEFSKMKLLKFKNDSYLQPYYKSINTFPGKMDVRLNKTTLKPDIDYIVALSSPAIKGKYKIVKLDSTNFNSQEDIDKFLKKNFKKKFILIDKRGIKDTNVTKFIQSNNRANKFNAKGYIYVSDRLVWGASDGIIVNKFVKITITTKLLSMIDPKKLIIETEAEYKTDYNLYNLVGYVKGKSNPDSFYVFTAHYDHIGRMGKDTYFPGANDNASGTSMVLDLAKYYSKPENQPEYSIAFLIFSGEESGLWGSEYYSSHPEFPLSKIKFLINLDMVGTGSDGITMVNATTFKEQYKKMNELNKKNNYLKTIAERGESCNSDHCPFYQKGVPAIFIFTMGSEDSEYHNIFDTSAKLPLTKYTGLFRLLVDYIKNYEL